MARSNSDWTSVSLSDLRAVAAVAETGSFRRAASALTVGQSAVSRRVAKLEDELGVSLFERHSDGSRLTIAGKCFVQRTSSVLEGLREAVEATRSAGVSGNGMLRLGIIASLSRGALRRVLCSFMERHSDVILSVTETTRSELLTKLSHRKIDALVASGIRNSEYGDSFVLVNEPIFLAVPSQHALSQLNRLRWRDVRTETFVVGSREPGPEIHDYILKKVSDLGRRVHVRRFRLGREGIMTLVGLGAGVSLVADHWRGVAYPNVTFIPIGDEYETVPFSITWRPENDNPALRRFISLARIEAKQNGALS